MNNITNKNVSLFGFFDLQAFAVGDVINSTASGLNADGTVNNASDNQLQPEFKEYYERELLENALPLLVHDQFGVKKDIPPRNGKKITFRRRKKLGKALTPLTEGVPPTGQKMSFEEIEAEVKQYGGFVPSTDWLNLTALDDFLLESAKAMGEQAGETLDTVVRDIMHTVGNVRHAASRNGSTVTPINTDAALDENCLLAFDEIRKAAVQLRAAGIKPFKGDAYVCILHPYAKYDITNDPKYVEWTKYTTPEHMWRGEIGRIENVRFVETAEAKIVYGPDLTDSSRYLTANPASTLSGAQTSIKVSDTLTANALKGRFININGVKAKVTGNTTDTISFASTNFGSVPVGTKIWPGEGAKEGLPMFSTLIIGDGAYGVTEIDGSQLKMIVKQLGSAGSLDPLDQQSTVGWKAGRTAEILDRFAMIAIHHTSTEIDAITESN